MIESYHQERTSYLETLKKKKKILDNFEKNLSSKIIRKKKLFCKNDSLPFLMWSTAGFIGLIALELYI